MPDASDLDETPDKPDRDEEWWRDAPPSRTIRADGLRPVSQRGAIGRTWWSRRFLEVLESLGMGGRLERGKRYARAGQVLSMSLSTSIVVGTVQGSRPQPYRVRIGIKAFTAQQWADVEQVLAGQALYLAKLLAGEMPAEIEQVFAGVGLTLFPDSARELTMDCSCPDWEVPCKHLAATCYLLAESFDADPFEILAWRGRSRQELLDRLRELRDRTVSDASADRDPPLGDLLDSFWGRPHGSLTGSANTPAAADAVLDQLAPLPITLRGVNLVDLVRPAYAAMVRPPL